MGIFSKAKSTIGSIVNKITGKTSTSPTPTSTTQYSSPIGPSQPIGQDTQGKPVFPTSLSTGSTQQYQPPQYFGGSGGSSSGGSSIPSSTAQQEILARTGGSGVAVRPQDKIAIINASREREASTQIMRQEVMDRGGYDTGSYQQQRARQQQSLNRFSGSVAEFDRGQTTPSQTKYYVQGQQTGRTYQQEGKTYAETTKPSTFTFKRGATEEAVQFTREGMSSATVTMQDVAAEMQSGTQSLVMQQGIDLIPSGNINEILAQGGETEWTGMPKKSVGVGSSFLFVKPSEQAGLGGGFSPITFTKSEGEGKQQSVFDILDTLPKNNYAVSLGGSVNKGVDVSIKGISSTGVMDFAFGEAGKKYIGLGVPGLFGIDYNKLIGKGKGEALITAQQIKTTTVENSDTLAKIMSSSPIDFLNPQKRQMNIATRAFTIRVGAEAIPTTPGDVALYGATYGLGSAGWVGKSIVGTVGGIFGVKGVLSSETTPEQKVFSGLVATGGATSLYYATPIPRKLELYSQIKSYASKLPEQERILFYETFKEAKSLRGISSDIKSLDLSRLTILENKPQAQKAVVDFFAQNKKLIVGGSVSQQSQFEKGIGSTKRPGDVDVYVKSLFGEEAKASKYAVDLAKVLRQNQLQAYARKGKITVGGEKLVEFHPYKTFLRPNIESVTPIYYPSRFAIGRTPEGIKVLGLDIQAPRKVVGYYLEPVISGKQRLKDLPAYETIKTSLIITKWKNRFTLGEIKIPSGVTVKSVSRIGEPVGDSITLGLYKQNKEMIFVRRDFTDLFGGSKGMGKALTEQTLAHELVHAHTPKPILNLWENLPYRLQPAEILAWGLQNRFKVKPGIVKGIMEEQHFVGSKTGVKVANAEDLRNIYKGKELKDFGRVGEKGGKITESSTKYLEYKPSTPSRYPSFIYTKVTPISKYPSSKGVPKNLGYAPTPTTKVSLPSTISSSYAPTSYTSKGMPISTKTPPYQPNIPSAKNFPINIPYAPQISKTPRTPTKEGVKMYYPFGASAKKGSGLFRVSVRRRGQFKPVGVGSFEKAWATGLGVTQRGLGQTFKVESVRGAGTPYRLPEGYYSKRTKKGELVYIEKPKSKINLASEKLLLRASRGILGRQTRNRK